MENNTDIFKVGDKVIFAPVPLIKYNCTVVSNTSINRKFAIHFLEIKDLDSIDTLNRIQFNGERIFAVHYIDESKHTFSIHFYNKNNINNNNIVFRKKDIYSPELKLKKTELKSVPYSNYKTNVRYYKNIRIHPTKRIEELETAIENTHNQCEDTISKLHSQLDGELELQYNIKEGRFKETMKHFKRENSPSNSKSKSKSKSKGGKRQTKKRKR